MLTRRIHPVFGQSNPMGTRPKIELTDRRYDSVQPDIRQWTRLAGSFAGTASAPMSIPATNFSLEAALGWNLRYVAGEYPLIFRAAGSGYSLETTWNVPGVSNEWADALADLWACYEAAKTEFAGDNIEFGPLHWWNSEADANDPAWVLTFEFNLRELVQTYRREFGKGLGVVLYQLSELAVPGARVGDPTYPADRATVRAAFTNVAASEGNCRVVDITPFELLVETSPPRTVHVTADASMLVGEAGFVATQLLAPGTQHEKRARAFSTLLDAQTFATSVQAAVGSRSENPATGGVGRRLGAGARDPWPVTPRSQVLKHPTQNVWFVPVDSGMEGFGLDLTTNLRPVDLSWLVYA